MRTIRNMAPWLVALVIFGSGFLLGAGSTRVGAGPAPQRSHDELFAPFWEVWDLLHEEYVDPLDDTHLMEAALNGMMDAVGDDYTLYMNPETFAIVNTDLQGVFEGIGATVHQDSDTDALVIINTLPDSPAERAGLLAGDAIALVDGLEVTGMSSSEIISRIRGPAGTEVELGIVRPGERDILIIPVIRGRIEIDSLQVQELENDLIYIRLLQFGANTTANLHQALIDHDVENHAGLILDFRGNPGGFLSTAIEVASEFLPDGVILKERFYDSERDYTADGDAVAPTVPMVILVDGGSASASELVAGALQDHGRATLIGTQTFGKGSVQSWHELSNGGGARITIARWYTPDDRSIQGLGLTPDIIVESAPAGAADAQLQAAVELLLDPQRETALQP